MTAYTGGGAAPEYRIPARRLTTTQDGCDKCET
jgi:hypothetical protein